MMGYIGKNPSSPSPTKVLNVLKLLLLLISSSTCSFEVRIIWLPKTRLPTVLYLSKTSFKGNCNTFSVFIIEEVMYHLLLMSVLILLAMSVCPSVWLRFTKLKFSYLCLYCFVREYVLGHPKYFYMYPSV